MTKKNIHINIDDSRLAALLKEQLLHLPDVQLDLTVPPDLEINQTIFAKELELPIHLGEWSDRVRYLLSGRDKFIEDDQAYDFGEFWLYADKNMLVHKESDSQIRLTDKERLLLRTLYDTKGQRESRQNLLECVWGYMEGTETHTLETHVYRLRQKLEPFGAQDLIQADGQGNYYLVGSIALASPCAGA